MADEKKGTLVTLMMFFGKRPGQDLKGFAEEVSRLSGEEKLELARLAAKELGLKQEDLSFSLE